MSDLTVVARNQRIAQDFIRREGLALSKPTIAVEHTRIAGQGGTVMVLDRPSLDYDMEIALSMLAQQGTPVINIEANPLKNAPVDVLAYELAIRFADLEQGAVGRVDIPLPALNRDYEIAIRLKDAPQEPPEFETAEEALAWLDSQEKARDRRRKHRNDIFG